MQEVGHALNTVRLYAASSGRLLTRGRATLGREERLVFVVGCPRSGTTFTASALGAADGLVDLGEVLPLKGLLPELAGLPPEQAAPRIRSVLERVRLLGLARGARGVEQTPETAFFVDAVARAYPQARIVHVLRDGRDVVCSLLERGWLSARRAGATDDAGTAYGAYARFWVERERVEEFAHASDATRAAWAWRRYVTAARSARTPAFELRYETMVADPREAAVQLAGHLAIAPDALIGPLARAHERSVGRFRRELNPEQLADVEREAGPLLAELGYA